MVVYAGTTNPTLTHDPMTGRKLPERPPQPGEQGYSVKNGAVIDNATGDTLVSSNILGEFDELGAGTFPRGNPEGKSKPNFAFDPRGFNLANFNVGEDIRRREGQLQNNAGTDAINQILSGSAPSLAQLQLQEGLDRNLANISSAANAQGNPLAFRQALNAASDVGMRANRDASMLRSQETMQALGADAQRQNLVNQIVELGLRERLAKQDSAVDLQKTQADELFRRAQLQEARDARKRDAYDWIMGGISAGSQGLASLATMSSPTPK
mgnify:CR=1 FL=1